MRFNFTFMMLLFYTLFCFKVGKLVYVYVGVGVCKSFRGCFYNMKSRNHLGVNRFLKGR